MCRVPPPGSAIIFTVAHSRRRWIEFELRRRFTWLFTMPDSGSKKPGDNLGEISDPLLDQRVEDTTSKIPTRASKLKALALGVLLAGVGLLVIFLAWAAIFLVLSYLI